MGGVQGVAGARLGALVRERRRAAGLTQRQLAERSGLSVAAVRDLEQGRSRRPRQGSLDALARALGLDARQSAALAAAGDRAARPALRRAPAGGEAPAGHDSGLWLAVLGPVAAWRDGRAVRLGPPSRAAVAGLLAVQPGELVRRETVIDVLWGQQPPATAAELVQAHVSRLRRVLDPGGRGGLLEQGPAGYRLRAGADELDAGAFAELAERAGAAVAGGRFGGGVRTVCAGAGAVAGRARREHTGAARASGCDGPGARRAEAVLDYADAACRMGWHGRVLPLLEELASQQPLEERVHARLMVALAGAGQQAAAIEVFEALRRRLDEDLGVRPGPELTAAHQRVLRQDIPPPADDVAAITGGPGPDARQRSAQGMVYSLPPDTAVFTGRHAELDRIMAAVTQAAGSGGVVAICAIGGMPGVGKTALAVHAAHLLKDRFPDRQLFVSLHAHTPARTRLRHRRRWPGCWPRPGSTPGTSPTTWKTGPRCGGTGWPGSRHCWSWTTPPAPPRSPRCCPAARAAWCWSPAAATSATCPARPPRSSCRCWPRTRRGRCSPGWLPAPPLARTEAVAELAELAGFLPLAVSLLARVFARHPSWTLADLVAETRAGMLTMTAERDSVAAAFDLSYRHLAPAQQQFFRRLGMHPGTSTDAYAAAALAEASSPEAAGQLDALHGEGLLTETGHRRYGMHDLIRSYARDLAVTDPPAAREQALDRLLDYYQSTAALAEKFLAPQARTRPAPALHAVPAAVPGLNGRTRALAWARAERDSLLACLDQATAAGQHTRVVALTAAVASLLRLDGPWTTAITRHTAAVQAARHLGDRLAQANALTDLGDVRQLTGDNRGAAQALEQALGIYRDIGDQLGQAYALNKVARVRGPTGDHRGAAQALEEALDISRDIGDQLGQANALNNLGNARGATGDYRGAAQALEEALDISRDIGDQLGQANALRTLGIVRQMTGDYRGAAQALEQALGIFRDIGDQMGQAMALNNLGHVRQVTGDYRGAAQAQEKALGIFRDIGSQLGQAYALRTLGIVRQMTGDYRGAAQALEQALDISRDISDRLGEAEALNGTGALCRVRGDPGRAADYHRQALNLSREIASPRDEACALAGLGRCALALGRADDAAEHLRQARDIFQRIGAAEAADLAAELDSLADPGQASPRLEQTEPPR